VPQTAPPINREARARVLADGVQHVLAHGFGDASLRSIAAALDTSHRMLIYHFGSAEQFWDALIGELRLHEQRSLAHAAREGRTPDLEEIWAELSSDRQLSRMRLIFEIYGRALNDRTRFEHFLSSIVDGWLDAIGSAFQLQYGLSPARARLQARLGLAVMRGLLLDLLTTGDKKGTTAALRHFAQHMRPEAMRSS
jgi:AcrR family transcriptional regulator